MTQATKSLTKFVGIGKVTNFDHKIAIDLNVKPVSQPLRCMPFSLKGCLNMTSMKRSQKLAHGFLT